MKIIATKLKCSLIITILNSLSLNAQMPNTWAAKSSIPNAPVYRFGAFAFSIADKGYVGGGNSSIYLIDFWEYDPLSDVWSQKADIGGGIARVGTVAFSINNKGYLGLGKLPSSSTSFFDDFWEYDPITNIWTQKANFGGIGRAFAIGFSIGNKGYVGLGSNYFTNLSDLWEYDPDIDNWIQKANHPNGNINTASRVCFSIGNLGYVFCGGNNSTIYEYDPSLNTWAFKAGFPYLDRYNAVGFSIGNLGYIGTGSGYGPIGGGVAANSQRDFWEYNPISNKLTRRSDVGGSDRTAAFGFAIGSTGYIGAGITNSGAFANDFFAYTPCNVDVSVIKNGAVITANQSGATYQWVSNCISGNTISISGATSQSYTTTADGSYAVNITYDGCISTSSCITISSVGIAEYRPNSEQAINVYPNPNNGVVTVKSIAEGNYQLINALGQTIKVFQLNSNNNFIFTIDDLQQGIYTLVGNENNQTVSQKIIVIK